MSPGASHGFEPPPTLPLESESDAGTEVEVEVEGGKLLLAMALIIVIWLRRMPQMRMRLPHWLESKSFRAENVVQSQKEKSGDEEGYLRKFMAPRSAKSIETRSI
ncbi:hypothetical protein K438DRAFT_1757789 [Mycena galopus ATCC 62051]|nr:hypothetical protein K438DRAFT_1757789 [Mycena galopus ATCC 62051]